MLAKIRERPLVLKVAYGTGMTLIQGRRHKKYSTKSKGRLRATSRACRHGFLCTESVGMGASRASMI